MRTFEIRSGVYGVDVGMYDDRVLSGYVVDGESPTVVEPGHAKGIDALCDGLRECGIDPAAVANVVVSHVHLDHSGAAAALAERAPDATVYIHPSTARHLAEPTGLIASSREAMGEQFDDVGAPDPLSADRIADADEGTEIDVGDRRLQILHTPGHAPDHVSVWDPSERLLFANEAIGSYFPKADTWLPPATLPKFDPEAVAENVDRLRALDPDTIALSHFGVRDDPDAAFDAAAERLAEFERRIPELYEQSGDVEATKRAVREELLDLDGYADALIEMQANVQTRGFLRAAGVL